MRQYVAVEFALAASALTLVGGIYLVAILDRWIGSVVAGDSLRLPALLADPFRSAAGLLVQQRQIGRAHV